MLKRNNPYASHKKSKSGFTLVELIVVIVVLGILAAIGIPRYNNYVNEGRLAHIQADMKTISGLIEVTAMDDDGIYRGDFVDDLSELEKAIIEGRAYKEGNLLSPEDDIGGDLHTIKDLFIRKDVRSKLKGSFLIDENDEVYYIANKKLKGENKPIEPGSEDEVGEDGCPIVDFGNMIPMPSDWDLVIELTDEMASEIGKSSITLLEVSQLFTGIYAEQFGDTISSNLYMYKNINDGNKAYYMAEITINNEEVLEHMKINNLTIYSIMNFEDSALTVMVSDGKILDQEFPEEPDYSLLPKYIQETKNGELIHCPTILFDGEGSEDVIEPEPNPEPEPEPELGTPPRPGFIPIANMEDLENINNKTKNIFGAGTEWEGTYIGGLDKNYLQVANIDLSERESIYSNIIGIRMNDSFEGIYDGNHFVISNYSLNTGVSSYGGFFGRTWNATIKNVGLVDINYESLRNVGGLIGSAEQTTIENCYSKGIITVSGQMAGGLVGELGKSVIKDSYSSVDIIGKGTQEQIGNLGGLVGISKADSLIERSYATGNVIGERYHKPQENIGGLVGTNANGTINECYATGNVSGDNRIGGVAGWTYEYHYGKDPIKNSVISNSYHTGSVTGKSGVGGVAGISSYGSIINSYASGEIKSDGQMGSTKGGIAVLDGTGNIIENSYYNKDLAVYIKEDTGRTASEMKTQSTYEGWNFDSIWEIKPGQFPTLRWSNK